MYFSDKTVSLNSRQRGHGEGLRRNYGASKIQVLFGKYSIDDLVPVGTGKEAGLSRHTLRGPVF